ncbi:MAG: hypothetical protein HN542_00040 [Flavobacteriales bacterium]|jgi:hypothetical protein|nr:hypothetical protein [Flavobacteriales bacterium]NCG30487.1 hypothetical protein [Bacteroidota bacterium]MBT4704540.1 hypothetical protein [Flavobacteriales bacterium]MBT6133529.1 hypothetical protein [Flavobacteriales bacterium]MBT6915845.1 hypothetical protein [Flavobacteriales bacterium]
MTHQKPSFTPLPRWLTLVIVLIFVLHFGANLVYQFGRTVLPAPIVEVTDRYIVPWFHQNYLMFAPDPAREIHTFLYRVETDTGWSNWKNPVYKYQLEHWSNKFGSGSDMYDILNGIADALYNGAHYAHFKGQPMDDDWFEMPGFKIAQKYIFEHSGVSIDQINAFQVGAFTEHHYVKNGTLGKTVLFQPYPIKRTAQ